MKWIHRRAAVEKTAATRRRPGPNVRRVVLVLLIAGFCWLAVPAAMESLLSRLINRNLSRALGVRASVRHVVLDLSGRRLALYGLRVDQPPGFGEGHLLYLPEVELRPRLFHSLAGTFDLETVKFADAEVDIRVTTNQLCNLQRLGRIPDADPPGTRPRSEATWGLRIGSLAVTNSTFRYHEATAAGEAAVVMTDIHVTAANLLVGGDKEAGETGPGQLAATAKLRHPPFAQGYAGIVAEVGPLRGALPLLNGSLRAVGIELSALAPLLPPNTAAVLGGDALDLSADLTNAVNGLRGTATIETLASHRYGLRISGTGTQPVVRTADRALGTVLSRARGSLGSVVKDVAATGQRLLSLPSDVAKAAAASTTKTVGSLGAGLLDTAKGVATLDPSEIGTGVKQMGAALGGGAKDAVFTAGGEIVEGGADLTDTVLGGPRAREWRTDKAQRWQKAWQEAKNTVAQAPFPPNRTAH